MSHSDQPASPRQVTDPEVTHRLHRPHRVPETTYTVSPDFDVFEWHRHMESCRQYFLDQGQHNPQIQVLAAFLNITLPFQRAFNPIFHSTAYPRVNQPGPSVSSNISDLARDGSSDARAVSLIPYIRRFIATAFDTAEVLQGSFGGNWRAGIGAVHEMERRNYLFACKSSTWLKVKSMYDMDDNQSIPFLKPLLKPTEDEIRAAETAWSDWLAMQDWMVGPRSPNDAAGRRYSETNGGNMDSRSDVRTRIDSQYPTYATSRSHDDDDSMQ